MANVNTHSHKLLRNQNYAIYTRHLLRDHFLNKLRYIYGLLFDEKTDITKLGEAKFRKQKQYRPIQARYY